MTDNVYRKNAYDVRKDGSVVLYQRPKNNHPDQLNPIFQVELKIPNVKKLVRLSSKCANKDEAIRFALEKYDELYRASLLGETIHTTPFSKAFTQFETHYLNLKIEKPSLKNRQHYIAQIKNHPYNFFVEREKNIGVERITDAVMQRYYAYRQTEHGVSNATLRRETTYINAFLSWCLSTNLISARPETTRPAHDNKVRATFTLKEWRSITAKMKGWVECADNTAIHRDRFYLRDLVLLMSNCGARTGEMRALKWGQVSSHTYADGETRMIANFATGKTGARESVCNRGSEVFFKRLWDYRSNELKHAPSPDEFVFCDKNGNEVGDRKKSFASLLNYCGLRTNTAGEVRSLYSLRHFYAHQQLRADPPVSVYDLARNMGTSVAVIESNYGDKDNVARGQNIGRKKGSWTTQDNDNETHYPFL
jgi:integrase